MAMRFHSLALRFLVVLLLLPWEGLGVNAQTQVTIGASKDNTLYENATGTLSNGAGQRFFAGRTNQLSGSIRRGLIAFDIASVIPAGALIQSVTLSLSMSQIPFGGGGAETISLNRVLVDWGEGTSVALGNEGGGAQATTGDATWLHTFFNTSFWSTPGGAYSPTPSSSQSVADTGRYTWGSTSGMISDVQMWQDTPSSNFGWMILGNESALQTAKRFDGKDNLNPAVRPELIVTYDPQMNAGEELAVPASCFLLQNYPNPFNPNTTISFSIPQQGMVTLDVYDLLGQQVASLVREDRPQGNYTVSFNASHLASGTYLYRLQAGSFTEVKKLLLVK